MRSAEFFLDTVSWKIFKLTTSSLQLLKYRRDNGYQLLLNFHAYASLRNQAMVTVPFFINILWANNLSMNPHNHSTCLWTIVLSIFKNSVNRCRSKSVLKRNGSIWAFLHQSFPRAACCPKNCAARSRIWIPVPIPSSDLTPPGAVRNTGLRSEAWEPSVATACESDSSIFFDGVERFTIFLQQGKVHAWLGNIWQNIYYRLPDVCMKYSGFSILKAIILRPPLTIGPFDFVPYCYFMLNYL